MMKKTPDDGMPAVLRHEKHSGAHVRKERLAGCAHLEEAIIEV